MKYNNILSHGTRNIRREQCSIFKNTTLKAVSSIRVLLLNAMRKRDVYMCEKDVRFQE